MLRLAARRLRTITRQYAITHTRHRRREVNGTAAIAASVNAILKMRSGSGLSAIVSYQLLVKKVATESSSMTLSATRNSRRNLGKLESSSGRHENSSIRRFPNARRRLTGCCEDNSSSKVGLSIASMIGIEPAAAGAFRVKTQERCRCDRTLAPIARLICEQARIIRTPLRVSRSGWVCWVTENATLAISGNLL